MKPSIPALSMALAIASAPLLQAQELSPRVGINLYVTQPADTAAKIYSSGWKVNLSIHVRREFQVEGRVRMEFGEFREGSEVSNGTYSTVRYSAQTRLVGYDWFIPIGDKRDTGLDLILGLGGAHWFRDRKETAQPGNPYYYGYSRSENDLGFAGTVGFRYRITRNASLEIHHVLTSHPSSDRDFNDAELSHTALGVGFRF